MKTRHPLARKDRLIIRELQGELLVYDVVREKALCLNPLAAAVWNHSDGTTSAAQIADAVSADLGASVDEATVWAAIDHLGRDHLLEFCIPTPGLISRRRMVKAAAVAGPVVTALSAPRSAAAASCIPTGQPCDKNGPPCCNKNRGCVAGKKGSPSMCA